MRDALPSVLIPGLGLSAQLYAAQIPLLWQFGAVMIADHRGADDLGILAQQILEQAPPRFALAGLSMGGYIAFEILRRAPQRVARLALLDTSAREDSGEQRERRHQQIELAQHGRYEEVIDALYPLLVHPRHHADAGLQTQLRSMMLECGAPVFVRQQLAIMSRPDSRASLAAIDCPTLVLVGDADQLTPPERAREITAGIRGAQLQVIRDSGHLSSLEQPAAVSDALVRWLT